MIRNTKKITTTSLNSYPKFNIFVTVFLAVTLFAGNCRAQEEDKYDIGELQNLFRHHDHKPLKYESKKEKPKNEMEFLMATGFNTYKAFFSSQDNPSCVFYPSCSSYSVQAFQQKGLFVGALFTFDRLSRCHHFVKTNQYIYDPSKQRFYDPVK